MEAQVQDAVRRACTVVFGASFVRQVARTLGEGCRAVPTLGELEDAVRIIWRAYPAHREELHHG